MKRSRIVLAGLLSFGMLLAAALGYAILSAAELRRQEHARANLLEVRKAVERYLLRDPLYSYPPSIEALEDSGQLPQGLVNPYSRKALRILPQEAGPSAGDICYIPEFDPQLSTDPPVAVQYSLLTYRSRRGPRFTAAWYSAGMERVDSHWILQAYNGWANDQIAARRVSRVRQYQLQQQHSSATAGH